MKDRNHWMTVTLHENDAFTVTEDGTGITVSDQFNELFGQGLGCAIEEHLLSFMKELKRWNVDINYTKKLPEEL